MGSINVDKCLNCGLELVDNGLRFYYDEDSKQIIEYMILMRTVNWGSDSKIRGRVSETYCGECGKFVRVYVILESEYENPIEIVREGIDNYLEELLSEIKELIEIKKREKYTIEKDSDTYIIRFIESDYKYHKWFKPTNIGQAFDEAAKKCGLVLVGDSGYEPPVFENIDDAVSSAKKDFNEDIGSRVNYLTEKYKRYKDSIILILDERDRYEKEMDYWDYELNRDENDKPHYYDSLEKIHCPECNCEIHKWIHHDMNCPNCDFPLICVSNIDVD